MSRTETADARAGRARDPDERVMEDRVLGGEWRDWTGEVSSDEELLDQGVGAFLGLGAVVILGGASVAAFFWWLASPRLTLIHPGVPLGVAGALFLVIGAAVLWWILVSVAASGRLPTSLRFLLPRRISQKLINLLLTPAVRLGCGAGLSRDRIYNSFIQVSNALVRGFRGKRLPGRLLLLLPRCMMRTVRQDILALISRYPLEVRTAGGGTGARRHVNELKPAAIVCVACERDLVSGIQDVAAETPVMALPNQRPHGPCKDTVVSSADVERAILHMLEWVETRSGGRLGPSSEVDS